MAYIPPSAPSESTHNSEDVSRCQKCGYNLKGLPWNTPCPECGTSSVQYGDGRGGISDLPLSQMPVPLVKKMAWSCAACAIMFPIVAGRILMSFYFASPVNVGLLVDFVIATIWILVLFALTVPIDDSEAIFHGLGEQGKLRKFARWSSLSGLGTAFVANVPGVPLAHLFLWCVLVLTVANLICLLIFLSEIAIWVRDRQAKRYLDGAAWGVPPIFLIALVLFLLPIPQLFGFWVAIVATFLLFGGVLGVVFLVSSVFQAISHARAYREYQIRRHESKKSAYYPSPE